MTATRGLTPFFIAAALLAGLVPNAAGAPMTAKLARDTLTVTAEGLSPDEKFALVFSRQAGSITEWYDLDRDPEMRVNLAAHGSDNGHALFQNRAEMEWEGKRITLFPGPAEKFVLVEANTVRTVVEISGAMTTATGEFPEEKLREENKTLTGRSRKGIERPAYATRFVVYPTGRIYIRHTLTFRGLPLFLASNHAVLATAPAEKVDAFNDHVTEVRALLEPSTFLLHHGEDKDFTASVLLATDFRRYRVDWLGQMMTVDGRRRGWVRSAFALQEGLRVMQPGDSTWNFLMQIEPSNVDSREAARLYVQDYLRPARVTFPGGHGSRVIRELEDRQLDGFAEGRGCYVASAEGKPAVLMQFDAGTLSRFNPAFEVHDWKPGMPDVIEVDTEPRKRGVHYHAHLDKQRLLIQYLGVLAPGIHTVRVSGGGD